jgi:hypothetical protein
MLKFFPAACWATLMIVFAVLARLGLADRDAVITMLMIMPILAVTTMVRGRPCCASGGQA